jgi:hypothetical protein
MVGLSRLFPSQLFTVRFWLEGLGHGQCEWRGRARHIGEFASVQATGKDVRVPLCAIYDLEDDKIKRARVYFETPALLQQLGMLRSA